MKLLHLLAVLAVTASVSQSMAVAADGKCRLIDKRADREACYIRQDEARATKLKAKEYDAANRASAARGQVTYEDEKLSRTLRSICRGC